uniref:Uncharacterized protein n=1 Tax=Glossina austeni TaxID=7395 RepID=A0A1A9VAC6_GLOAU
MQARCFQIVANARPCKPSINCPSAIKLSFLLAMQHLGVHAKYVTKSWERCPLRTEASSSVLQAGDEGPHCATYMQIFSLNTVEWGRKLYPTAAPRTASGLTMFGLPPTAADMNQPRGPMTSLKEEPLGARAWMQPVVDQSKILDAHVWMLIADGSVLEAHYFPDFKTKGISFLIIELT